MILSSINNAFGVHIKIKVLKTLCSCLFLFITSESLRCQSTAGITGIADTSYSTYSAYTGTLKTHPDIKIVGEIKDPGIKEQRRVTYCTIGKRDLKLDVFYPAQKNNKSRIAIIIIHGGGWRTGNRSQHYPLAQMLATLGYVCFTPEYRLSTEALFPAGVFDIKAAIRWVRKTPSSTMWIQQK